MPNFFRLNHISKSQWHKLAEIILIMILICMATASYVYFSHDQSHLLYGDALSRMNISRKLFDNLTPGFAQVGNVWLPLPQLMMAPFTTNDYLWRSGLAGAFMSGFFFVLGGYSIYKAAKLLTDSIFAAYMSSAIFALNINVLYLQTTAMSELSFLGLASFLTFTLVMWAKSHRLSYLLLSALSISLVTLTRYEGLALLASSTTFVFAYSFLIHRKYKNAEGSLVLFGTLAVAGFAMWTLYLATIFGDPLYWKNYYIGSVASSTPAAPAETVRKFTQDITIFAATWKYFTATVWMNGLIPVTFALFGYLISTFKILLKKMPFHLPIFLHLSVYAFLVFTLTRNTPINQPALTLDALLSFNTNYFIEFNLRYGILMLPAIAVASSYLFAFKNIFVRLILVLLVGIQILNYIYPFGTLIYQIPVAVRENITRNYPRDLALIEWFKENYDGGPILISAAKHDPKMFNMGIDYKNFIHEGTQQYWTGSLLFPPKYAKWIIYDYYGQGGASDSVYRNLKDSEYVTINYDIVYDYEGIRVYKIKTKPDIDIGI
ncbi:MAG: hypothetical protein QG639_415 [Patescibacteria group bacterium]|nr:hypothetical protein [Patescibacteria group bacterium]